MNDTGNDQLTRLKYPDESSEKNIHIVFTGNNQDIETGRNYLNSPNRNKEQNLYDYLNLDDEKIGRLKFKIFSNGKRIYFANAILLKITYFLIIFVSLLYFIFV